jgi:hypothetical protein
MSTLSIRILVVGPVTPHTEGTLKRLARAGWGSHCASTVREAETILRTIRFKVILSAEKLPDGLGYELAGLIARQSGTLFIGVALTDTCLWLPAVERGERSLGRRTLNPAMLESELEDLLRTAPPPTFERPLDGTMPGAGTDLDSERIADARGKWSEIRAAGVPSHSSVSAGSRTNPIATRSTAKMLMPPREHSPDSLRLKRLENPPGPGAMAGAYGKGWRD